MIQFKAQRYKKMIASFYRDHPVATIRAWKSLELNSTANSGTTSTITHGPLIIFILHRISILLRPLYRMEVFFFFSFLFFFTSKYSRATVKYILREWNNTGENGGVPYREQERFVNGVNFFNRSRGCLLRFNSRRILMAAPLSTIFLHLPFHDSLRVKRVCLRPRIYTNLE